MADVLSLGARVKLVDAQDMPVDGVDVRILLRSGEALAHRVAHARGSLARPLTDGELEAKFRALCATGCPALDPDPLIEALWSLAEAPDAAAVIGLSAPR
jgi:hypothetical protein